MFINIRALLLLPVAALLAGITLCSCSQDNPFADKPVNMNSGQMRSNNYTDWGTFSSSGVQFIDKPAAADTSGAIVQPLVMDIGKIAFATRDGSINVSLSDDTLWTCRLPGGLYVVAGMCADKNQNLYALANDGTIYSYSDNGTLRWKFVIHPVADSDLVLFSDLLALSDGVVAASSDGMAVKIDSNGKQLWTKRFTGSVLRIFPADNEDNVYLPVSFDTFGATDSLYCISSNGKIKWGRGLKNSRIIRTPVLDGKNIYLPIIEGEGDGKKPKIIALDRDGKQAWAADLPFSPRFISAADEDEVIVSCYDMSLGKPYSEIICFNSKGKKLWVNALDLTVLSPVMISENCYTFVGARENNAAVFYYKRDDEVTLFRDFQMPDYPPVNLAPVVLPGAVLTFAGSDEYFFLRIDDSKLDKMLPW